MIKNYTRQSFDYIVVFRNSKTGEKISFYFLAFENLARRNKMFFTKPLPIQFLHTKQFVADFLNNRRMLHPKFIHLFEARFFLNELIPFVYSRCKRAFENYSRINCSVFFTTKTFYKTEKNNYPRFIRDKLIFIPIYSKSQKELCGEIVELLLSQILRDKKRNFSFRIYSRSGDPLEYNNEKKLMRPIDDIKIVEDLENWCD